MSFVVTAFSWAGWMWTGVFFAVIIPLLWLEANRRRRERPGFEVIPVDPDAPRHG